MISLDSFGAPAFVAARREDGHFFYEQVNEPAARLTGLDRHAIVGRTSIDVFGPAAGTMLEARYEACLDQQVVVEFQGTVPVANREVATRTTLSPFFDRPGEPATRVIGVTIDVTEQIRLQNALRRSEARLAVAIDALDGSLWYYDIQRREFDLGAGFERILGVSGKVSVEEWLRRMHPDDRADSCFAAIVAGRIECGSNEFRVFSATGEIRWLSCRRRAVVEGSSVVGVAGIVVDCTSDKRREEALNLQASTDPLTGIANRRRLDDILAAELKEAVSRRRPLSLLMIDVDHFKRYNDSYGHVAGDGALRLVAECLREVTATGGGTAARFGGEEFAIVLPSSGFEHASMMACAVLAKIRSLRHPHRGSPLGMLSVSIGVASMSRPTRRDETGLVALADAALYRAKADGRDCYRVVVEPSKQAMPASKVA